MLIDHNLTLHIHVSRSRAAAAVAAAGAALQQQNVRQVLLDQFGQYAGLGQPFDVIGGGADDKVIVSVTVFGAHGAAGLCGGAAAATTRSGVIRQSRCRRRQRLGRGACDNLPGPATLRLCRRRRQCRRRV